VSINGTSGGVETGRRQGSFPRQFLSGDSSKAPVASMVLPPPSSISSTRLVSTALPQNHDGRKFDGRYCVASLGSVPINSYLTLRATRRPSISFPPVSGLRTSSDTRPSRVASCLLDLQRDARVVFQLSSALGLPRALKYLWIKYLPSLETKKCELITFALILD
jgi:hypothetical protein